MDNMLSDALREFHGQRNQLETNLIVAKDREVWGKEFSRFLRMEPCWTESPNGILLPDDNVTETMDAVARLSAKGYLDTSFNGRAVHPLVIRPLSKMLAFAKYRKSDGKTYVYHELEKHMPYQKPTAQLLLVMNMQFRRHINSDDALDEMGELGVQPFFGEWFIQFGCAHPNYQEIRTLVALGTKFDVNGVPLVPDMSLNDGVRDLGTNRWGGKWGDGCRFPVVIKGIAL